MPWTDYSGNVFIFIAYYIISWMPLSNKELGTIRPWAPEILWIINLHINDQQCFIVSAMQTGYLILALWLARDSICQRDEMFLSLIRSRWENNIECRYFIFCLFLSIENEKMHRTFWKLTHLYQVCSQYQ